MAWRRKPNSRCAADSEHMLGWPLCSDAFRTVVASSSRAPTSVPAWSTTPMGIGVASDRVWSLPDVQEQMMKIMAEDRDYKQRVKRRFKDKGIGAANEDKMSDKPEKKRAPRNPSSSSGVVRHTDGDGGKIGAETMPHVQELTRTEASDREESSSQKR